MSDIVENKEENDKLRQRPLMRSKRFASCVTFENTNVNAKSSIQARQNQSTPDLMTLMKRRAARSRNKTRYIETAEPTTDSEESSQTPLEYIKQQWVEKYGSEPTLLPAKSMEELSSQYSPEQIEAYNADVVQAVRNQDIATLRMMRNDGRDLKCGNRFGESIMHIACRKGFIDVVTFLMNEAGVSIRVRDDCGRTPMHDALWTAEPNFELLRIILVDNSDLLLVSDNRGHTPFDYIRKEHRKDWIDFLSTNKSLVFP